MFLQRQEMAFAYISELSITLKIFQPSMLFVRTITLLVTMCFTTALLAQVTYRGKITDKETQRPLQGASVFFSNTSYGTTSAADGSFTLTVPQAAKFDLVVAMVGYETSVINVGTVEAGTLLAVALKPAVKELDAVVLQAYEKDGWNKWGRFFLENFIGTSEYAADCSIKNYKDIRFRHNKTDKELTVVCYKPLIIENKALGYTLRYQLEQFTYNFKTRYLVFSGHVLFEEMQGSERKVRKWKERREEVFSGSVMHFMRSVFVNRIKENHFLVYRMRVVPNLEKKRVGEVYRKAGPNNFNNFPADSVTYYNSVMRQANAFNYLYKTELTGDSIAYAIDSVTVGMTFEDHLVVVYTQKKEPAMYRQQTNEKGVEGASASSSITLVNSNEPLEISSNGAFMNPVNMITADYWAWAEKIAFMLPLDYKVRLK